MLTGVTQEAAKPRDGCRGLSVGCRLLNAPAVSLRRDGTLFLGIW